MATTSEKVIKTASARLTVLDKKGIFDYNKDFKAKVSFTKDGRYTNIDVTDLKAIEPAEPKEKPIPEFQSKVTDHDVMCFMKYKSNKKYKMSYEFDPVSFYREDVDTLVEEFRQHVMQTREHIEGHYLATA